MEGTFSLAASCFVLTDCVLRLMSGEVAELSEEMLFSVVLPFGAFTSVAFLIDVAFSLTVPDGSLIDEASFCLMIRDGADSTASEVPFWGSTVGSGFVFTVRCVWTAVSLPVGKAFPDASPLAVGWCCTGLFADVVAVVL